MKFEWDDKKNEENKKKHGLYLDQAIDAFSDPMAKERYDDMHSQTGEERMVLVGFAKNRPLYVIFTEPAPDTIRIISARKAAKHELEDYYGNR